MRRLSASVDWPKEIRAFIEERIKRAKAEENLMKVIELLRGTGSVEKGLAAKVVRDDRDSR